MISWLPCSPASNITVQLCSTGDVILGLDKIKPFWLLPYSPENWRNLNLAICDCEAKFHCVILACR